MIEKQHKLSSKTISTFTATAPLLFVVPKGDYEDEMEKKRDKKLFQKLQSIEKEIRDAKDFVQSFTIKHQYRMTVCRQLLTISRNTMRTVYPHDND